MQIAFIGGGNMAEAILSAVLKDRIALPEDILVSDIDKSRLEKLQQQYHVRIIDDNVQAVVDKDIIILAVKPQVFGKIAPALQGKIQPTQLVISILAGTNIRTLSTGLAHQSIVRSMPNTPAQIGEGMTVWTATPRVSAQQREAASSILGAMGAEIYVEDENFLDMATAISGSGPAYVFLFVESLIDAAMNLGFSPENARTLVMQTLLGASHLLQKSGKDPQTLRQMVTSPGGTTAEAISVFEEGGFSRLIQTAVNAAFEKARQLGEQRPV